MERVRASTREIEIETKDGRTIAGLIVKCEECGHLVEVYGTSGASARRGALMLRQECPEGQENFYVVDDED